MPSLDRKAARKLRGGATPTVRGDASATPDPPPPPTFFLSELGRYQAILASPFGSCATMFSGHCVSALRLFMFFFPCLVSFRGILLFVFLVRPGGVHNQRDRGAGRQRRVGRDCHGPARPEGLCLLPARAFDREKRGMDLRVSFNSPAVCARLTEKSVGWIFGSHLILPPGAYAPQVGSAKVHWYGGILSSISFAVGRQAIYLQADVPPHTAVTLCKPPHPSSLPPVLSVRTRVPHLTAVHLTRLLPPVL